ncbi:hypothetical protein SAMN04489761_4658 [Tenacibaculum sp. MAR_2009_124]|uniref:hypothetical protein n=1 Tax=Tenacibaculum sp. MAR_2009_124 TaxID=1250059 RepID=UPI0008960D2C|nr:hypothetical protein [Tenacibaculum sp. MAR_2009_124]SED21747.1 hypothetical protein SAMN04489761_4658 [Tenacibaculum sp. MAR_2009_124]
MLNQISCKKVLLYKYKFIPVKEGRATINEIIAEKRNLPIKEAKLKRLLRPSEVIEFLKRYDLYSSESHLV